MATKKPTKPARKKPAATVARKPRAVGRPTKFTPETCNRIISAIRNGNTYEASAHYGGVSYDTLREWIKRGQEETAGEFSEFFEAIKSAEAKAEVESVALIRQAAQEGQWQAAAWFLERRKPSEWGRKDRHEVSGINGEPIKHEVTKFEQAAQKIYGDDEE